MKNKEALTMSYKILSPYSDRQLWEFNSNLIHLNFLTSRISKKMCILDVGCGIGILALALVILGYNIDGVDKFIFQGNNSYSADIGELSSIWSKNNLKISNADISADSVIAKYDVVISVAAIEHQQYPKQFIQQMMNKMDDGGYIYVATPNTAHLLNRIRFLFGRPLLGNLKEFFDNGTMFVGHWREYSLTELIFFFKWSGLEIIKSKNIQSVRPTMPSVYGRGVYVNFLRLLSYILPGMRDTNIIFGRKTNVRDKRF